MLNPKICRKSISRSQYGLFAAKRIREGELVWTPNPDDRETCVLLTLEEIEDLPPPQREVYLRFCYQVERNLFSGCLSMEEALADDANFMNHSCDPNCWYEGESLVARRDIAAGEEITYDYGTDSTDRDWGFKCSCGSPLCRGTLRRDDWTRLTDIYGTHFSAYITRELLGRRVLARV